MGACDLLQCDCSLNPQLCTLSYRFTLWPPQEEEGRSVNSLDHPGCQHESPLGMPASPLCVLKGELRLECGSDLPKATGGAFTLS